jgi:hypothetical protein
LAAPAEPAGPRVAAALEALALQSASGVLEIGGNPSGCIYLDRGQVTFAQASWAPDLSARLRELPGLPEELAVLLMAGDDPDTDVGAALIGGQFLSRTALRAVLRSLVVDALVVLTTPLPDGTSVTSTRFLTPRPHWARSYARLPLDSVRAQAAKRAAVLAQAEVLLCEPLELLELSVSLAVLKREHWEVASRVNGSLSIIDLAWESGIALYEAIERVAYLIKKGMCASHPAEVPAVRNGARGDDSSGTAGPGLDGAGLDGAGLDGAGLDGAGLGNGQRTMPSGAEPLPGPLYRTASVPASVLVPVTAPRIDAESAPPGAASLVQAVPRRVPGRTGLGPDKPGTGRLAGPAGSGETAGAGGETAGAGGAREGAESDQSGPTADQLRRVLEGLRRL